MFAVDPSRPVAPYEQIKQRIATGRDDGTLPAGHRLPPVRRLAEDLGVAANTVARAYRELEAEGVVVTRGRAGTFVAGTVQTVERAGLAAARDYLARVVDLGLSERDAARLLAEVTAQDPGN